MIIKMTLPALFRHRKCIAAQTRVELIRDLLDDLNDVDDKTLLTDEWDTYIRPAENSMRTLAEILNERAKSYIETKITPSPTTNAPKEHDKRIEAYLDGFDEFCEAVMERYDADVIENLTSVEIISLCRGFLTALPDIEKAEKSA